MQLILERPGTPAQRRLTILVCCYNQSRFIEHCLRSINESTALDRIDLIVIDDGSSDDTVERLSRFAFGTDLRVRCYVKPNGGLTESLRLGLALAQAPFISIMAGDDFYAPGAIDRAIDATATMHPSRAAKVFQCAYTVDSADHRTPSTRLVYGAAARAFFALSPHGRYEALCVAYPKPLLIQSTVFGVDLLRGLPAWSENIVLDDWPTFIKIAAAASRGLADFDFEPGLVLSHYRVHSAGQHANPERFIGMCLEVARKVVPAEHRAQCERFIYSEGAVMYLARRRLADFARCYARSVIAKPGLGSLVRVPALVSSLVWKRLRRARHGAIP